MRGEATMMLLGGLLAAVLPGPARPDDVRRVVDDQGKPVAGARVVLYAAAVALGQGEHGGGRDHDRRRGPVPAEGPTPRTHARQWRQRAGVPARAGGRGGTVLPASRTRMRCGSRSRGPSGSRAPMAGRSPGPGSPRGSLYVSGGNVADIPESLADPLAVTTGADGRATLRYLTARDQLVAARVTTDSIGTQDILLIERPARGSSEPVIAIRLEDDADSPAGSWTRPADPSPTRWSRSGRGAEGPGSVPIRSSSRAARSARPPTARSGPRTTSWSARPIASPSAAGQGADPLRLDDDRRDAAGPAPDAAAAVADGRRPGGGPPGEAGRGRRGLPVGRRARADRDPERPDGRFSLGGFRRGPVFLFVRGDGFRFHGQLIREGEGDVTVELTRTGEPPARGCGCSPSRSRSRSRGPWPAG